jgi:hypothetical protein
MSRLAPVDASGHTETASDAARIDVGPRRSDVDFC